MVAWIRTVLVEEAIRDPVLDFSLKVGWWGLLSLDLDHACISVLFFLEGGSVRGWALCPESSHQLSLAKTGQSKRQ